MKDRGRTFGRVLGNWGSLVTIYGYSFVSTMAYAFFLFFLTSWLDEIQRLVNGVAIFMLWVDCIGWNDIVIAFLDGKLPVLFHPKKNGWFNEACGIKYKYQKHFKIILAITICMTCTDQCDLASALPAPPQLVPSQAWD